MSLRVPLVAPFFCLIGLIIAALVIATVFGASAAAITPSPTPSPTAHVTDVGVSVVKEEQITTQKDVTSTHDMTITVTNGNYPADVHLTVLAVSKLGVCEARLIPVGGDHYMEFQTDEDNNAVNETLYSELDIDLNGMAAGEVRTLQRSYSLVCNVASPPMNPYEIQADVLPQLPVQEANLGNPPPCPSPWCVPGATGGPQTTSDNVHKNFPHIILNSSSTQTCPNGLTPPWPVPPNDPDCDGFTSSQEAFVGTDPSKGCAADSIPNNESLPNRWPLDFNNDQLAGLSDVARYASEFGSQSPGPPYAMRFDLNGDGRITLPDVTMYSSFFGKRCTP